MKETIAMKSFFAILKVNLAMKSCSNSLMSRLILLVCRTFCLQNFCEEKKYILEENASENAIVLHAKFLKNAIILRENATSWDHFNFDCVLT